VRIIKLEEGDSVSSVAFLNEEDKEENGNGKE
jgi:hypothetical protein